MFAAILLLLYNEIRFLAISFACLFLLSMTIGAFADAPVPMEPCSKGGICDCEIEEGSDTHGCVTTYYWRIVCIKCNKRYASDVWTEGEHSLNSYGRCDVCFLWVNLWSPE